ncbi:MAG: hypothetical protein NTU83_03710, partial [Candidatus Hydrogenedentes bacterium]|nr:hypothetical protein [Candidatus Hydrogenedentota bacterium]
MLERKRTGKTCWPIVDPTVNARALQASEMESSWQIRRSMVVRDRLCALRLVVEPCDMLAGKLAAPDNGVSESECSEAAEYLRQYPSAPGQTGHCELDLDPLMAKGIDGIVADIENRLASAIGESADVYRSFLFALNGLSAMIARAGTDADAAGRAEIADSCRRIAHEPPETFRDAIQLLWFTLMGVMEGDQVGLVVPGHLDRTLRPFYERDIANGTLAREEALELIANLYLLINDYIPDGLAMS